MSHTLHELTAGNSGITLAASPARIAIFQALNLGDFLCTTPALRAVRRRYPEAEITMIGRPWAKELASRLPAIDRFLPFPGFPGIAESPAIGTPTFAPHPPYDLAIQMHGSGDTSNGYVASLGAAHTLGFGPPGDTRLTTVLDWIEHEPEPLRWLRLVSAFGASVDGAHLDLPVTIPERQRAAALMGPADGRPVIGLHAGSSLPNRRWPAESFAKLADALASTLDARIVLTGSTPERPITARVQRAMQSSATDLAGLTSIGEFAAVIGALDLLVTNDTGASHVAAAMKTRSVVLFGPTSPDRWAPVDLTRHHIIDADPEGKDPARGEAALQALSPELVAARCEAAMREAQFAETDQAGLERIA